MDRFSDTFNVNLKAYLLSEWAINEVALVLIAEMFNRVDNDKGFSEPTKRIITNSIDWQKQKKIRLLRRSVILVRGTVNRPGREFKKRNGYREILNKFLHSFQIAAPQLDLRAWVDNYHSSNL